MKLPHCSDLKSIIVGYDNAERFFGLHHDLDQFESHVLHGATGRSHCPESVERYRRAIFLEAVFLAGSTYWEFQRGAGNFEISAFQ